MKNRRLYNKRTQLMNCTMICDMNNVHNSFSMHYNLITDTAPKHCFISYGPSVPDETSLNKHSAVRNNKLTAAVSKIHNENTCKCFLLRGAFCCISRFQTLLSARSVSCVNHTQLWCENVSSQVVFLYICSRCSALVFTLFILSSVISPGCDKMTNYSKLMPFFTINGT